MEKRGKILAMVLAGGQGSRLKSMTKDTAKPSVPFGGKYRIIDFTLSNAANSGISQLAILTQYKPYKLNEHIGIGAPWDFNRNSGGVSLLSPFESEEGGRWFTGTANAIYENIGYIDEVKPEYVLILSGDHIYKMNYMKMVDSHIKNDAACTVSVIEVPWEEASRFGIINVDENLKIVEFEEKPEKPKNNLASMGIYVFNWSLLKEYLIKDEEDGNSSHDFGKDILPKMLKDNLKMYAWKFKGYWKDVGTVKSYWEANLDLLDPANTLNLFEEDWRIYTNNLNLPPQFISSKAKVKNSMINEGCRIYGNVNNSVIFSNVKIEEGATVKDSVIHSNVVIKEGAKVENAVIMEDLIIEKDVEIGESNKVYLVSEDEILSQ